jgi:hypothetical protein
LPYWAPPGTTLVGRDGPIYHGCHTMLRNELETLFEGLSKVAQGDVPRVLYHYTSVAGLCGIVEHRQMWASHCAFTNDPAELHHADDHLRTAVASLVDTACGTGKAVLGRFLDSHPAERVYNDLDIFVACFSIDGDSLPQWRAYADDGRGYAIGLDTTYGGKETDPVPCGMHGTYAVDMYKVEYSAEKLQEELRTFLKSLLSKITHCEQQNAASADLQAVAYRHLRVRAVHDSIRHKHRAFEHEGEWRMVVTGESPHRKNRPCRGVPLPYVPLDLAKNNDPLPIHEVRVGPGHASRGTATAAYRGTVDLLYGKCMRADVQSMVPISEISYHSQ